MVKEVVNRCSDCNKKSVCKYAEDMKEITDDINFQLSYVNTKDLPFSIVGINCDYFSAEIPIIKGSDIKGGVISNDKS